jgi:hypothetical protein
MSVKRDDSVRKRAILLGGGVAVCLALAWVAAERSHAADPSLAANDSRADANTRASTPAGAVPPPRWRPSARDALTGTGDEGPVEIVEPEPERLDPQHARIAEHFEHVFRDQSRSAGWADGKEAAVRDFFATQPEAEGSRLLSADCRQSLCRIRLAHDGDDARDRLVAAMGLRAPFTSAGARFPDPDPNSSVLYLAREGTGLPWPSREPAAAVESPR